MNNELLNLKITDDCVKDYIRSIIFKNKESAGDLNQKIEAKNQDEEIFATLKI